MAHCVQGQSDGCESRTSQYRFCRPASRSRASQATPTCHLFVANCGPKVGISAEAIAESLARICGCTANDVIVTEPDTAGSSAYVFVSFPSADLAIQAKRSLEDPENNPYMRNMVVDFADVKPEEDLHNKDNNHFVAMEEEDVGLSTEKSRVPGLSLYKDFISVEEEDMLLKELYQKRWDQLSKRRVQHYGKIFRYDIRAVDSNDTSIEIPGFLNSLLAKAAQLDQVKMQFKEEGVEESFFDQVTVNEYLKGVGLSTHVDTHSAFVGPILSLTLAGHTVMKFRPGGAPTGVHGLENMDDLKDKLESSADVREEALLLSRRSLLAMTKEARYEWAHYIPPRKTDVVSGERLERPETRVSITLRRLRRPQICRCQFQRYSISPLGSQGHPKKRDSQQCDCSFPRLLSRQCDSFWRAEAEVHGSSSPGQDQNEMSAGNASKESPESKEHESVEQPEMDAKSVKKKLRKSKREQKRQEIQRRESELRKQSELECRHKTATTVAKARILLDEAETQQDLGGSDNNLKSLPKVERVFVREVYEHIAPHFSSTRYARWPKVVEFLQSLQPGAMVADAGCGNGKYLGVRQDCCLLGSDSSVNLLKICRAKGFDIITADTVMLPYRSDVCDAVISIAVLHHLSTTLRRLQMIRELVRISKRGGRILITAWAEEQEGEDQKRAAKWHSIEKEDSPSSDTSKDKDFLVPWNFPLHRMGVDQREWVSNMNKDQGASEGSEPADFVQLDQDKGTLVYNRYYHVFRKGELEDLCYKIEDATIENCFYDKSNWCIVLVKR